MSFQWPYQFITLSEEDKVQRRALLDLRGQYAQWSIIFAILIVKTMKTSTTFSSGNRPKRSSSIWDRPLFPGWAETRGQYLACGLWLSWLVALSAWNSGNGMQLTIILSTSTLQALANWCEQTTSI